MKTLPTTALKQPTVIYSVDRGVGVVDQNDQSAPASQSLCALCRPEKKGAVR